MEYMKHGLGLLAGLLMGGLAATLPAQHVEAQGATEGATTTESGAMHMKFAQGSRPGADRVAAVIAAKFGAKAADAFQPLRQSQDGLGQTHLRFQQLHEGYPVFGAIQNVHLQNGEICALNGHFYPDLPAGQLLITEEAAVTLAISSSGAGRLIGQSPAQDAYLRRLTGKADATWKPSCELMYAPNQVPSLSGSHRLAWKVDVYSIEPLFRADIYIDAATGQQIWRNERLHTADANGTGHTKFSGQQAIVTDDSAGTYYRLRETGRALGVETYDMLNQTDYFAAVDITQSDNDWDTFPTLTKRAGLDAHWGAEMTYDYFLQHFNLDSYDDLSSKLISFVHYDNGYSNAYWNGQFMTYGDGGGNNNPFPGLDVCGHEFTHGVTEYAAGLIYQNEPGALNESFSDIFGNSIEFWSRPNDASWGIGDDIGAFRSMAAPKTFFNPDTYLGDFWNSGGSDNGGVHTNSGVQNYWYYLLTDGGSGVNDNGDSYLVHGLGLDTAAMIAYRNLNVYLTPTDGYKEARYFAIQSAIDLFGECSPQMIETMNAWYAVGVGNAYTGVLNAGFYTPDSNTCQVPASVQFQNGSTSALNFLWDFGDGNTSNAENPLHQYAAAGTYTVTLIAYGCNGSTDTLVFPNRVNIDPMQPCVVNMPTTGNSVQNGCEGFLYDSGGASNYLPNINSSVTIDPLGNQQITLVFTSFDFAAGDRITIYDGTSTQSPQLGLFAGNTLPPAVTSTSGALTIYESTNGSNNRAGFQANWSCFVGSSEALTVGNCEVFPNPTSGKVQLRWERNNPESCQLQVVDALGRIVLEEQGSHQGIWDERLDLSHCAPGVYSLQLQTGSDQVVKRIIVQ